jgi:sRNA-binding protein
METLTRLAERFPVFALEPWEPHLPLKLGIHHDILASGLEITQEDLGRALRFYCCLQSSSHPGTACFLAQ